MPTSITQAKMKDLVKQIHPDSRVSADAKKWLIKANTTDEKDIGVTIDLAGMYTMHERKKRTINADDLTKASLIVQKGPAAIKAEHARLSTLREILINGFSFKSVKQMMDAFKQLHPDSKLTAAAKTWVMNTNTKDEKSMWALLDMAGSIAIYERKRKSVNVDDLENASKVISNGPAAVRAKTKSLETMRLAMFA